MILCICEGVSDRTIREEVQRGAGHWREVERRCGTGKGCGMCRPMLRQIVKQTQRSTERRGASS